MISALLTVGPIQVKRICLHSLNSCGQCQMMKHLSTQV